MSAYSDLILATTGLVGYWRLGDASGDAIDAAGGLDGTVTGTPYSATGALTGDADTAYDFDGDEAVLIPNDASTQLTTGSLELWLNSSGSWSWVSAKHNAFGIFLVGSNLGWFDWGGSGMHDSGVVGADGTWHHVVLTFQSGVAGGSLMYRDGVEIIASDVTVFGNTVGLAIGADHNGSVHESFTTGVVDEVALYSVVLTPTQIAEHYDMGVNGPPPSIAPPPLLPNLNVRTNALLRR